MADVRILATGLRFPEGPVAMADGAVVLGEIAGGTVTRVAADGAKSTVTAASGGPNGLARGATATMAGSTIPCPMVRRSSSWFIRC